MTSGGFSPTAMRTGAIAAQEANRLEIQKKLAQAAARHEHAYAPVVLGGGSVRRALGSRVAEGVAPREGDAVGSGDDGATTTGSDSDESDLSERGVRQASVDGTPFVIHRASQLLKWYNCNSVPKLASLGQVTAPDQLNLVLFEEAVAHLCRATRVLRMPGRHAVLLGVGGCGKRSIAKLAAFSAGRFAITFDGLAQPHAGTTAWCRHRGCLRSHVACTHRRKSRKWRRTMRACKRCNPSSVSGNCVDGTSTGVSRGRG